MVGCFPTSLSQVGWPRVTRPGKRLQLANLKMAIEIVDLPINGMMMFHSYANIFQRVKAFDLVFCPWFGIISLWWLQHVPTNSISPYASFLCHGPSVRAQQAVHHICWHADSHLWEGTWTETGYSRGKSVKNLRCPVGCRKIDPSNVRTSWVGFYHLKGLKGLRLIGSANWKMEEFLSRNIFGLAGTRLWFKKV